MIFIYSWQRKQLKTWHRRGKWNWKSGKINKNIVLEVLCESFVEFVRQRGHAQWPTAISNDIWLICLLRTARWIQMFVETPIQRISVITCLILITLSFWTLKSYVKNVIKEIEILAKLNLVASCESKQYFHPLLSEQENKVSNVTLDSSK